MKLLKYVNLFQIPDFRKVVSFYFEIGDCVDLVPSTFPSEIGQGPGNDFEDILDL